MVLNDVCIATWRPSAGANGLFACVLGLPGRLMLAPVTSLWTMSLLPS